MQKNIIRFTYLLFGEVQVVFFKFLLVAIATVIVFPAYAQLDNNIMHDCGRGEAAAACIKAEQEFRDRQARQYAAQEARWVEEITKFNEYGKPGYRFIIRRFKGKTHQISSDRFIFSDPTKERYIALKAYSLSKLDGTPNEKIATFDFFRTNFWGDNKTFDSGRNVNSFYNTVAIRDGRKLKINDFSTDMVVFIKAYVQDKEDSRTDDFWAQCRRVFTCHCDSSCGAN